VLLLLNLNHCGYSPVYNNKINDDLKIYVTTYSGDRYLNQKLIYELKPYFDINEKNTFQLDIESKYDNKTISKDITGKTTDLEIFVNINFKATYQDYTETFSIKESIKIKSKTDAFEQQKYEKIIRDNFAKSIKQRLLLKLINIKQIND
uniref:hypothetical protein n=1 Tax=Candidatus Pelagibacter sp. HIMB1521 TaxID=3413344 RepID=UPI003F858098